MENIQKREIALCIVFTLITCGIYGLYWVYKINEEINIITGNQDDTSGGLVILFGIITCGIYYVYWAYKIGKKLDMYYQKNDQSQSMDNSILFIILMIANYIVWGVLGLVCYGIMQDNINKIIEK